MKNTSFSRIACALAAVLALGACSGSDGAAGATGPQGPAGAAGATGATGANGADGQDLTAKLSPEACGGCHSTTGTQHQAVYNTYKDASAFAVTIDSVVSTPNSDGTFTSTMKFTVTKDGQPYVDAGFAGLDQKKYGAVPYDSATRKYGAAFDYASPTHIANGQYSVTNTKAPFAPEQTNAQVYVYVVADKIATEGMQLYSNVKNVGQAYGDASTYVSSANVAGCEKCHGTPYMKHGYRGAAVAGLPDFAACKTCHYDSRDGHDTGWQLLVDDPAAFAAQNGTPTADQNTKYAYKASIMNDVHMSHAMEFAYPQSMANCATCHEGKLDVIQSSANFNLATCKSCHPVKGVGGTDPKRAPALEAIIPAGIHSFVANDGLYTYTGQCTTCHRVEFGLPTLKDIHPGYNKAIYADSNGTKYSSVYKVAIGTTAFDKTTKKLTVNFSATKTGGDALVPTVGDIKPTVAISLYGYDTKDFIVSGHGNAADGKRNLEVAAGATNPRLSIAAGTAAGTWVATADLSTWADKIADGSVKRVEVGVMPKLQSNPADSKSPVVALDATTKTVDLGSGKVVNFYKPIVDPAKCNACHDALATTFHSPDRGGNVVNCRICHAVTSGSSHFEMQSRSIDSFIHATHSFQKMDIEDVNFADPVAKMEYEHHVESTYPNFTITNCESCHYAGTYDVPSQSKSLPGILSASSEITGATREISGVKAVVTGPATRACGSCHRAAMIKEDSAGGLEMLNEHTTKYGYAPESTSGVFEAVVAKMMGLFQ